MGPPIVIGGGRSPEATSARMMMCFNGAADRDRRRHPSLMEWADCLDNASMGPPIVIGGGA